ncbi:thioesterase II family protein [Amycolatopsis sp. MEPSY49]|uniref:thioesterase II family protein n=1 Tax=Amycolatopsis sp. MEPSY49 TaxID=3151600 RepID=UPI003EF1C93F
MAFVPPACCGAGYFRRLRRLVDDRLEIRAVELPGRGRRYSEPTITQAGPAAKDLTARLGGRVDAIYGESLGAYLGLAVAAGLDQDPPPVLLAASNSPPCARRASGGEPASSIEEAIAGLAALGGEIPAELLTDRALAESAFPLLRDDLSLSWSLIGALRETVVACRVVVLGGRDDTTLTRLGSWAAHTTRNCTVTRLPGDHLLSASNPAGVARVILGTVLADA